MMALVHDIAEADVGDITPEQHSGVTKAQKLELEAVSLLLWHTKHLVRAVLMLVVIWLQQAMDRIAKLLGHPSLSSLRVMELWHEYEARE